jgi:hypothetical protein
MEEEEGFGFALPTCQRGKFYSTQLKSNIARCGPSFPQI